MMNRFFLLIFLTLIFVSCSSRAKLAKLNKKLPISQLSQHYTYVVQEAYCGNLPIVRFVNFLFEKKDSLQITIDITTSLNENKINGDFTLLVDDYEVEYASTPTCKQYTETLELESHSRYPSRFRSRQSLANILINSATKKVLTKDSQKQYWNTSTIVLVPEDETLLLTSSDISFSLKTIKCELMIYPSYEQVEALKRFLQ